MKRQKVKDEDEDEDFDYDFDEGDTDEEKDDDFTTRFAVVEDNIRDDDTIREYSARYFPDGEKTKRRCLDGLLCHKYQHVEAFEGLPIFELFKVKVRFNDKFSSNPIDGRLYGAIVTSPTDENPDPIYYYWVSKQKPDSIALDSVNKTILLPLSNPRPRPPIDDNYGIALKFAFKVDGKDIFNCGNPYKNPELFDYGCGNSTCKAEAMYLIPTDDDRSDRTDGAFIARIAIGEPSFDRILMGAYYSVYYGAWATVDVKFLDKGVSSFYGSIFARPCIFFRRIRLLSIQPDQKGELDQGSGSVSLTRSVVAVPSYASLIIAAALYDHGGKPIVRGKTFFPAQERGRDSNTISHEGVDILDISVKWECDP